MRYLVIIGFIALVGVLAVALTRADLDDFPSALIGQSAPSLPRVPVDGTKPLGDTLTDGQVTLVNFWASWCPPCRAEHPRLMALSQQGVRIIGVNFNDTMGNAQHYLQKDGNPYAATVFDPKGRAASNWGVIAPPETFIIDAQGKILFRYAGPLVGADYKKRFIPAFNAAGAGIQLE